MNIVADESMPLAEYFFGSLGDVQRHPGRTMNASVLSGAEVLLVRSITQVNPLLLEGSPVTFVGSATIGTDHVDLSYLARKGIRFSHAPGCNARAVAEYVLAAVLYWASGEGCSLDSLCLAVVGYGHVGREVAHLLGPLMRHVVVDPFLDAADYPGVEFVSMSSAWQADIVTLHVPLTREGAHSTFHLLNQGNLSAEKTPGLLINAARGGVVDNRALQEILVRRPGMACVLDVWEGEPGISPALLKNVLLGSPHVAGHTLEGKYRGTWQLYLAACEYFGHAVSSPLEDVPVFSEKSL